MATELQPENNEAALRVLAKECKQLRSEIAHLHSIQQASSQTQQENLRLKKECQFSQLRFETIFEQSLLGNKILTSDLLIRQINPALVTLLGYSSKEEIIGTRILDYAHPEFKQHWHDLQDQLWREKIPNFRMATCLMRKDGSSVWVQVTSILFEEGEETFGYTIVEDISASTESEQQAQRLYESQELMVDMVAHDLKNPIHTIGSLATLLQEEVEHSMSGDSREKSLAYVSLQRRSCQNADAILKYLLVIGKLETEMMHTTQPVDITTLIKKALEAIRFQADQKSIRIDFQYPPNLVYIPLQTERFSLMLDNLFSNAIKFSNSQSTITIKLSQQKGKVRLSVQDQGIGIPHHLQSSIFNKFTKANRSGAQGEETTGLGLFIIKRIVQLHKGEIWLESAPGQGTTFYIDLPLKG